MADGPTKRRFDNPRVAELKEELRGVLRGFWRDGEKYLRLANRRTGVVIELAERDRRLDGARRDFLTARLSDTERDMDLLAGALDRTAGRIRELEAAIVWHAPRPRS